VQSGGGAAGAQPLRGTGSAARPSGAAQRAGHRRGLRPRLRHRFDLSLGEARALQERLRSRVVARDAARPVRLVAGADVSYDRGSPVLFAAVVVLDARRLSLVEVAGVCTEARFPYVPGYLSFREIPALLEAFARLRTCPDLVVCDGQGRAHPRRFGLACHLGVLLDLPTIGCAKSRLVGEHETPGRQRRSYAPLRGGGQVIGSVLRTQEGVNPVYVSVGHRISLARARRAVLALAPRHRLPEPVRAAHAEVNRMRRAAAVGQGEAR
jgi:deoxyribonuclease V